MTELTVQVDDLEKLHALFGDLDSNIGIIQKEYGVSAKDRGFLPIADITDPNLIVKLPANIVKALKEV